jgi:hypothetical protein
LPSLTTTKTYARSAGKLTPRSPPSAIKRDPARRMQIAPRHNGLLVRTSSRKPDAELICLPGDNRDCVEKRLHSKRSNLRFAD